MQRMVSVQCWTGAETKALRQAMRLSIRAFAGYLGIDARTVNKWEARHTTITLRPHTQALMDTALARASEEVRTRFSQTVSSAGQENHENAAQRAEVAHDAYTEPAPSADFRTPLPGNDGSDSLLTELSFDSAAEKAFPLLAVPNRGGQVAWEVPADPNDRERLTLAARHPRRVDAATVCALADILAATRHIEDQIGSAGVLSGVRSNTALARNLLSNARPPIRDRLGSLTGELHQYLGWLLAETGYIEQARAEFDAALALGVEFDDPNLISLALSFKGHLAWMMNDPHGVVALSCAARRDERVFVAQHAFNAHQEARGWAMAGEPREVDRALVLADKLAERAVARQADTPPNLYWYGSGFFTLQRGLTWHTLGDIRFAERAVTELANGLHELPEAERDSEWAAIFVVAAVEALTTAGEAERAVAQAHQAMAVCRATRSTRLAHALRHAHTQMRDTWPTDAAVRELGDEIHLLSGTSWVSGWPG